MKHTIMRLILSLILALPLFAQLDIPLMSKRPGLSRSGLAAGVNVTGGVDTQSIASIPPGTATLVRGANTGASTDDPTVSLAGWTFDSGDRVSGLPAKGAAWTTTNCSGVECYTVTSGGQEYINGVARRNRAHWSESAASWTTYFTSENTVVSDNATDPNGTVTADTVTFGTGNTGYRYQLGSCVSGLAYTASAYVWSASKTEIGFRMFDGSAMSTRSRIVLTTAPQRVAVTALCTATGTLSYGLENRSSVVGGAALDAGDVVIWGLMLNLGSTALEYQKTTDSREWLLETPGNYVGLLTGWYRWDRVLNPGEVLNNYRAWLKPRINSVGNTLP